jgi:hypothetical protein
MTPIDTTSALSAISSSCPVAFLDFDARTTMCRVS